jgi:predicted lipoprotein with Yx(FWY)xxD motif
MERAIKMKHLGLFRSSLSGAAAVLLLSGAAGAADKAEREDYVRAALPMGIQVINTEVDGNVFADATGKTLYRWPTKNLRNGDTGDSKGKSICDDHKYTETSGLMSPYPAGLELPDAAARPSCAQLWPAAAVAPDAKPVGQWTITERADGHKQWAYEGFVLYTSVLDRQPGDVFGGDRRRIRSDSPALRQPVGPEANVPPQFQVTQLTAGRMLTTDKSYAVYAWDRDGANKSNCDAVCLTDWEPVMAAEHAVSTGDWSVFERSPGIKQWAFRKRPLYTHVGEEKPRSMEGSDIPGWHNVFTQQAPPPPKPLTVQVTRSGLVAGDAKGHSLYIHHCADDAIDQLACNGPDGPQEYRFAICGGHDISACLAHFPYVIADKNAKSDSRTWSVVDIDPKTGHRAKPGQADALHVWAYRDKPVFTFYRDVKPGLVEADGWGEFNGWRNGFKALWLRDDFRDNAG